MSQEMTKNIPERKSMKDGENIFVEILYHGNQKKRTSKNLFCFIMAYFNIQVGKLQ